jgi:hypothetical protein
MDGNVVACFYFWCQPRDVPVGRGNTSMADSMANEIAVRLV